MPEREGGFHFDMAFVGANSTQFLSRDFFASMAPDGVVIAETAKFIIDATDEAKETFVAKINALCGPHGWSEAEDLTKKLHERQPPLKELTGAPTEGQKRSIRRYHMPFQVAFKRGSHGAPQAAPQAAAQDQPAPANAAPENACAVRLPYQIEYGCPSLPHLSLIFFHSCFILQKKKKKQK